MIRTLAIAVVLVASTASAQFPNVSRLARGTTLSPLPNDASPPDYWAGAYMDQAANCARFNVDGQNWLPCTATVDDVAVVQNYVESLDLTLSGEIATVYAMASGAQSTATSAATAASAAQTTANNAVSSASSAQAAANNAASAASSAQTTANAAQTTASNAGTSAAAAQSTANAAQAASNANATAITALQATVAGLSKRACGSASISGVSIPLLGISSTTTVAIAGAPVGTSCDVGLPSFLPLGAKPVAAVLTAGTASLRFEGNSALLSAVIAIPSGTYRVCCDL